MQCADPRVYYEYVEPSSWQPEPEETCLELHRRAYCGGLDAAFPLLFVAGAAAVCHWRLVPLGWLLAALPVVFVLGVWLLVVRGEGALTKAPAECSIAPHLARNADVLQVGDTSS